MLKRDPETPDGEPREPRTEHSSLALRDLLSRLEGAGRQRVTDLGCAIGANVSFLAKRHCTLRIVDLQQDLRSGRVGPETSARSFARRLEREMPVEGAPADAILAWDLLNYLNPGQIEVLGRHVAGHCRPGTMMLAFISTRQWIAASPIRFEIDDRKRLIHEVDTPVNRECPRYREPDLERLLPDFTVEVTYLLRNGFQEYLFAYSPRSRVSASPALPAASGGRF